VKSSKISKSDLARELKVAPSTISTYVARGMPVGKDGKLDRDAALGWIQANVKLQGGRRGVGVRAARRQAGEAPAEGDLDPVRESARLTKLRGDKLEKEIARLQGGTESEYAAAMGEAVSKRVWWEGFQAEHADGFAFVIACLINKKDDIEFLHLVTQLTKEREGRIMVRAREIICDGFVPGLIEPDRDPVHGVPWRPIVPARRHRPPPALGLDEHGRPYPPRKPETDDA
jgi:hypothetical protein